MYWGWGAHQSIETRGGGGVHNIVSLNSNTTAKLMYQKLVTDLGFESGDKGGATYLSEKKPEAKNLRTRCLIM
jgi:hypothetical protein